MEFETYSQPHPVNMNFVEVAVPLPMRQTFTYRLPESWASEVKVGSRLLVPFGRQTLTAYAVALHDFLDESLGIEESKVRDVLELLDDEPLLNEEILQLAKWTANYYATSWGEVLKAALPAGVNATIERIAAINALGKDELAKLPARSANSIRGQVLRKIDEFGTRSMRDLSREFGETAARKALHELEKAGWINLLRRKLTNSAKPKRRKAVRLQPPEKHADESAAFDLNEKQRRVIDFLLENNGECGFTELTEGAEISSSILNTLEKKGLIEIFVREVRRDPLQGVKLPKLHTINLTDEQKAALSEIENALSDNKYKTFLLHGVTGSGKTEIYIRAIRHAISQGKTAMMLVPEIALTPVFAKRLRAHFGDLTAIFHSNLSIGERFDEWRRLKAGAAKIVIGTRSAVFAPIENIGLIVIDEEHDGSYRQNESPFYNGRDVGIYRGFQNNAVVVLGSATPALESFHNVQLKKYQYLRLKRRVENRPLAQAEIIDMREVFKIAGKEEIFSPQLLEAIAETHGKGEQSIILLNRRGYSSFVLCRECGETIKCPNCDVTLTYHKSQRSLICHYCNHRQYAPKFCPNPKCGSEYIYYQGEGTEQIEENLRKRFPDITIARVDRDTMNKRRELERILHEFDEGKIGMLVGTQMLAKGHDFHNVTLVGVVSVDAGLALPDFRSAERTFQLLTQVAGRAGRGDLPGRVLIQTYYPEHYALQKAQLQDYQGFYDVERRFRQRLGYPPFVALASILIKDADLNHATNTATILRNCLERADTSNACRILGAANAPISRIKNEHRLQILVKSNNRKKMREVLDFAFAEAEELKADLRIVHLEIDPINLL